MNRALHDLATTLELDRPEHAMLRLQFGLACTSRVRHLLEDPRAIASLEALKAHVAGRLDPTALHSVAQDMVHISNAHRGSGSIDGTGHAAVSATYAVANALAGKALDAAGYAAYAAVYAYGGYALNDPSAFEEEFEWQVEQLRLLARRAGVGGRETDDRAPHRDA